MDNFYFKGVLLGNFLFLGQFLLISKEIVTNNQKYLVSDLQFTKLFLSVLLYLHYKIIFMQQTLEMLIIKLRFRKIKRLAWDHSTKYRYVGAGTHIFWYLFSVFFLFAFLYNSPSFCTILTRKKQGYFWGNLTEDFWGKLDRKKMISEGNLTEKIFLRKPWEKKDF